MIVTTTQDLAAIGNGNCPCGAVQCPAPRVEHESITLNFTCYFTIPNIDTRTDDDLCRRFLKYTSIYHYDEDSSTGGNVYSNDELTTTVEEAVYTGSSCSFTQSVSYVKHQTNHHPSAGVDTVYHQTAGKIRGGACTGSYTYTDNNNSANNYTGTNVSCNPIDFTPTDSWDRAGDVFTSVETVGPNITITANREYSDELKVDFVTELLAAKSFPNDKNSTNAISFLKHLTGCPETIIQACKSRYRLGIPASYSPEEAPRSTYELQWDEVFFPTGYDALIDDPEVTPPDPLPNGWQHPQIPDPAAPDPSLVAEKTWVWDGDRQNPWSDWHEIPLPASPGETRVVNLLVTCYRSSRAGQKPTSTGEVYALPA